MLSSRTVFCKPHHRSEQRLPGMLFSISLWFSTLTEIKRMKTVTFPMFLGFFFFYRMSSFRRSSQGNIMIFIISADRGTGEISVCKFSRKIKTQPCRSRAGVSLCRYWVCQFPGSIILPRGRCERSSKSCSQQWALTSHFRINLH